MKMTLAQGCNRFDHPARIQSFWTWGLCVTLPIPLVLWISIPRGLFLFLLHLLHHLSDYQPQTHVEFLHIPRAPLKAKESWWVSRLWKSFRFCWENKNHMKCCKATLSTEWELCTDPRWRLSPRALRACLEGRVHLYLLTRQEHHLGVLEGSVISESSDRSRVGGSSWYREHSIANMFFQSWRLKGML